MSARPYEGQRVSLATRHAKEEAIAPVFHDVVGLLVEVIHINTDAFGTFTGDIPRIDSPINTAVAKARAGISASGLALGLASEGTIGPDPFLPFVTADMETIVFVDDDRGIIINETFRSTDIVAFRETVNCETDVRKMLDKADFPRHGLIVRPPDPHGRPLIKGITREDKLFAAVRDVISKDGTAVVESDLRACFSPSRMRNIRACATRLARRIATPCPDCGGPGWGQAEPMRGLPCSACGTFVESAIRADVFGCPSCPAVRLDLRPEQVVEPRWCPYCNP